MAQFNYYPDHDDDKFTAKNYRKKEFYDTRTDEKIYEVLDDEQEHQKYLREHCDPDFFKLQNYQIFVRNYISPATPYKGILLYHGVGTGKTCAAIQIAEGFKDDIKRLGQKIIVIAPKILQDNFEKNLYDFKKERATIEKNLAPGQNQCTGQTYYIPPKTHETEQEQKIRMKTISARENDYYEYYTYQLFIKNNYLKMFEETADPSVSEIRKAYDNTIFIIDEAHMMIEGSKKTRPKKKIVYEIPEEHREEERVLEEFEEEEDVEIMTPKQKEEEKKEKVEEQEEGEAASRLYNVLIEQILKKAHNVRVVLLSATPMRNQPMDLVQLINLLRMNDYKSDDKLIQEEIFQKGILDMDDPKNPESLYNIPYLQTNAIGYVSYVRGENPLTYAKKRDYKGYLPRPLFGYNHSPILMYLDSLSEDRHRQPFYEQFSEQVETSIPSSLPKNLMSPSKTELIDCPMSAYQYYYMLLQESSKTNKQLKGSQGGNNPGKLTQLLLIVYPKSDSKMRDGYALESGKQNTFKNTFKVERKKWVYKTKSLESMLHTDQIGYYSTKYKKFLTILFDPEKARGTHYLYTRYVNAVICLALALEQNGYAPYRGTAIGIKKVAQADERCYCGRTYAQHKTDDKHKFKQARYMLFTSGVEMPKQSDIDRYNKADNSDGRFIKVILSTKIGSIGVDYKRIRHMHIMDPWHNATEIDQTIGRALRHCAHADLKPDDQVVTIYKYSAVPPTLEDWQKIMLDDYWLPNFQEIVKRFNELLKNKVTNINQLPMRETNDERLCRRSYFKDQNIKYIERAIKEIAVDCYFNYWYNKYPTDEPGTRDTEYIEEEFKCREPIMSHGNLVTGKPVTYNFNEIDLDTFKSHNYFAEPILRELRTNIMTLYRKNFALDLKTLRELIYNGDFKYSFELTDKLADRFLYLALDQMIGHPPNQVPIELIDQYFRRGYLIYRHPYYVFQPEYIVDTRLPQYYREQHNNEPNPTNAPLLIEPKDKSAEELKEKTPEEQYQAFIERFSKRLQNDLWPLEIVLEIDKLSANLQKYYVEASVEMVMGKRPSTPNKITVVRQILDHYETILMVLPVNKDQTYIHGFNRELTIFRNNQWMSMNTRDIRDIFNNEVNQQKVKDNIVYKKTIGDMPQFSGPTKSGQIEKYIDERGNNFKLPEHLGLLGITTDKIGTPKPDQETLFKYLNLTPSEIKKVRSDATNQKSVPTGIVCTSKPLSFLYTLIDQEQREYFESLDKKPTKKDICEQIEINLRELNREDAEQFHFLDQFKAYYKRDERLSEKVSKVVFDRLIFENLIIKEFLDWLKK